MKRRWSHFTRGVTMESIPAALQRGSEGPCGADGAAIAYRSPPATRTSRTAPHHLWSQPRAGPRRLTARPPAPQTPRARARNHHQHYQQSPPAADLLAVPDNLESERASDVHDGTSADSLVTPAHRLETTNQLSQPPSEHIHDSLRIHRFSGWQCYVSRCPSPRPVKRLSISPNSPQETFREVVAELVQRNVRGYS